MRQPTAAGPDSDRPGPETFERTTELRPDRSRPGRFDVDLDPTWSSLNGLHGGYLTALAVRAAERSAPLARHDPPAGGDPPVAAVSAGAHVVRTVGTAFLRAARVGPAELVVTTTRAGRSLTTLEVAMHQEGRAVTATRITAAAARPGPAWTDPPDHRPAPPDACVAFEPPEHVRHFAQAEGRLDPADTPFTLGPRARVAGHVRPLGPRPLDAAWLAMAGDWFPPSPFSRSDGPVGGVSIDYTIQLHRTLPRGLAPGAWLGAVFETGTAADGMALERGTLIDPDGSVLAETFHTRWTG